MANTVALLLLLAVLAGATAPPFNDTVHAFHPSTINISFFKEVTLSVAPQDIELTPQAEQDVSSFLESALRLFDPIMRLFDGWMPPKEKDMVHV
jgi:hypothetical protein